ncbi:DNA polymerase III subunit beta [Methylacidimicrobium cyclopophantes]|uniref:Beta sliding clamp n=1 Tax=Methylacidimicrobium cyclopophantes TaxID=1041766 RepID=A0A5E6MCB2_9BACT|nr:DNA polymerase III subunit beta [Methylacidimicrobium cyclopophantes]VVM05411.1 DNA polymerase III subunit beta [Methylacidimicrobium cyclopophantes]
MQCEIVRTSFLEALNLAQSVVGSRTTLPILNNVLLDADPSGKLSLFASDLQTTLQLRIDAEVKEAGRTTLPARRLFAIAKEVAAKELTLTTNEKEESTLIGGRSSFRLFGMPANDYPTPPALSDSPSFCIPESVFVRLLRRTAYAMSNDEMRYVLHGELICWKGARLTVVATDGKRLALMESPVSEEAEEEIQGVVPARSITELLRILSEEEEKKVAIWLESNRLLLQSERIVFSSKLVDGKYPNYRAAIPQEGSEKIYIPRETFLSALRRVSIVAGEKLVPVRLHFQKDELELLCSSAEIGEAKETVPIRYGGEQIRAAFNVVYLMEPLRESSADEIALQLREASGPCVFKDEEAFLYVVMPMRNA